jgi:hypothetical protein
MPQIDSKRAPGGKTTAAKGAGKKSGLAAADARMLAREGIFVQPVFVHKSLFKNRYFN